MPDQTLKNLYTVFHDPNQEGNMSRSAHSGLTERQRAEEDLTNSVELAYGSQTSEPDGVDCP